MAYPNMFQQINPYQGQNQYQPGFQNPYQPHAPQMQVVRVSGRNGADAFQIGPNSSVILLDESGTLIWLVTTDGAGYKTVSPYDITPHQAQATPDYGSLEARIKRLEDAFNGNTSDSSATKRRKPDAVENTAS